MIPVYNCENYIFDALESIKNQTFSDFECIVVNDGSTDDSSRIIKDFVLKDKRFKFIDNGKNMGIVYTLNRGLKSARGKYIARMDADDISVTNRFERQVNYMENNPDVIVLGTGLSYISAKGRELGVYRPPPDNTSLLYQTPIFHATVLIRKNILDSSNIVYREMFNCAEDYCFWLELSNYGKFHSLNENLYLYRNHTSATRFSKLKQVLKSTLKVKLYGVFILRIKPSFRDIFRFIMELVLLAIPSKIVVKIYLKRLRRQSRI